MLFRRDSKLTTFGVSGAALAVGATGADGSALYGFVGRLIALIPVLDRPLDLISGAGISELSPAAACIAVGFRPSVPSLYL